MQNKYDDRATSDQDIDLSLCSVFIGNIPYNMNEQKLKDIFSTVGAVKSIKLIFDHETGKPKGFGFCEYSDEETAISAKRNLNGYAIQGRALRVDNACTERARMVMEQLFNKPQAEQQPFGAACDPAHAPDIISRTVASLPPERMLELVKETKQCIVNNPVEARQMFLHNPQLAYAMLQTLVAMKIIPPQMALGMLHEPNDSVPVLGAGVAPNICSAVHVATAGNSFSHQGSGYWQVAQPTSFNANATSSRSYDPCQRAAVNSNMCAAASTVGVPMSPLQRDSQAAQNYSDTEKRALIMQVMQLSEAQIEQMSPEKRAALTLVREEIGKSAFKQQKF